ncbi:hypothetical protein DNTS_010945 [Danionella cerebrum]|nr:hypothetical protein DNTS_010945 [Danionella translucida]
MSLQLSPVQESDFVLWHCEQIRKEEFKKTYRLHRVFISTTPAVIVGDSLSLDCKVEPSSVEVDVSWIPPVQVNADCTRQETFSSKVSISAVTLCHSGTWTCKLQYLQRVTQENKTIFVIDLAPSPSDPIYTSVSPSSSVDIPCSLSSQMPLSLLNEIGLRGGNWSISPMAGGNSKSQSLLSLNLGEPLRWVPTPGANITVTGREFTGLDLSIRNLPVSEKIRGVYTCSLMFQTRTLTRKVKLEVLRISSSALGSPVTEGQNLNLTCTLGHANSPDLLVKWKCFSCPSESQSHPSLLSIPIVTMQHNGWVQCELWKNAQMLTSAELFLRVVKAPVDVWLYVAISSGVVVFILLMVIIVIYVRKYKQMLMYRRRKTRFCCCEDQQPKGFYRT